MLSVVNVLERHVADLLTNKQFSVIRLNRQREDQKDVAGTRVKNFAG